MILVFAKSPEVGRVKTRLGASVGMEKAADVHCELLERTLSLVTEVADSHDLPRALYLDGDLNQPVLQALLYHQNLSIHEQVEGDLGLKMLTACQKELETQPWVIVIGTDCPVMDTAYLEKAIIALQTSDVVIGPAEDGGYVLLGARKIDEVIFSEISWGESSVLRDTLTRLEQSELSFQLLSTLWDVDYLADWQKWLELNEQKND